MSFLIPTKILHNSSKHTHVVYRKKWYRETIGQPKKREKEGKHIFSRIPSYLPSCFLNIIFLPTLRYDITSPPGSTDIGCPIQNQQYL